MCIRDRATPTSFTHPNHSGEVTSTADGAQVIASNVVDEDNLKVSNSPTNGQFLSAQSGNTGGLTWADAGGGVATEYDAWTGSDGDPVRFDNTVIGLTSADDGWFNWSRVTSLTPVGSGMTESAGVWTFPSTGMWKIQLHLSIRITSAGTATVQLTPQFSSNSGTSYTNQPIFEWRNNSNYSAYSLESHIHFQNVSNATNDRIRFSLWNTSSLNMRLQAMTKIEFTKVA